jgi:hypothetical protein
MIVFMLAMVLLSLFVGSLAFVTGPLGLVLATAVALWLLVYIGRSLLGRKATYRG